MKCKICKKEIVGNKKSFSNHYRWCSRKMSRDSFIGINKGEKNGMWKGDNVGYYSLHEWVKNRIEKTLCVNCGNKSYDLANISGEYKRDLDDWEWFCRKCHMIKDGRLERSYA